MSTIEEFTTLLKQKPSQDEDEIDYNKFYSIINELIPSKTSEQCLKIFNKLSQENDKINVNTILNNDDFISFLGNNDNKSISPQARNTVTFEEILDADDNGSDSFIPNDNFSANEALGEEKSHHNHQYVTGDGKSHMLSYQDVEILQNQLKLIYKTNKYDDHITFDEFCEILKNMLPSPEKNENIKSLFNELDINNDNTISFHSFMDPVTFRKFLQSLDFIVLDKKKTITNDELEQEMSENNRFYFRALSIHNMHDREIILSEAETIEKLKHWIDVYGKPAQLKCQNLQFKIDENSLTIMSLNQEVDELRVELMTLKEQNELFLLQTGELKQSRASLQQQVSIVHEEMQQHKQLLSLSDTNSEQRGMELKQMKLRFEQSVTTKKTLEAENDQLKEMNLQNVDENLNIKKQLREKDLLIKSLQIDKVDLQEKIERLNGLIAQQQDDINLLESENAEQTQEIDLLRTKTHNNDIALNFRKTDGLPGSIADQIGDIDIGNGFDIHTTNFDGFGSPVHNVHDDIIAIPDMASEEPDAEHLDVIGEDDDNDSDQTDEMDYRLLHQKSMETANDFRAQIIALKQQLFDEQRKREELELEIELKMKQELRESMIRRRSRSKDYYHENNMMDHVQINIIEHGDHSNNDDDDDDGIPLLIKENDDASSPDELQPFVKDNHEDNHDVNEKNNNNNNNSDEDNKTPKCCRFLFGIC